MEGQGQEVLATMQVPAIQITGVHETGQSKNTFKFLFYMAWLK